MTTTSPSSYPDFPPPPPHLIGALEKGIDGAGEEGENGLPPPYSTSIRLATLCHRKREFQAAFDKTRLGRRTWELVWLVLDGTALRVYLPSKEEKDQSRSPRDTFPNTGSGGPSIALGEGQSGASIRRLHSGEDSSGSSLVNLHPSTGRSSTTASLSGETSTPSSSLVAGRILHRRPKAEIASSAPSVSTTPSHLALPPTSTSTPRLIRTSTGTTIPTRQALVSSSSHNLSTPPSQQIQGGSTPAATTPSIPDFEKRTLLKQYHLRHAVCMRANSYTKREHVLRFILNDGKQFLIQLNHRSETIAWLQLMSIAAPLCLDLDERPMPEPAYYPRIRPRPRLRRPVTAPGALEGMAARRDAPAGEDPAVAAVPAIRLERWSQDGVVSQNTNVETPEEDGEGDLVFLGDEMDHLPPPRPPLHTHSLSSVDMARRRGINL